MVCLLLVTTFSFFVFTQVGNRSLQEAEKDLQALIEHEWDHLELPSHQSDAKKGTPHFRDIYLRIWKEGSLLYDSYPVTGEPKDKIINSIKRFHNGHHYKVEGYYDLHSVLDHLDFIRRILILSCLASFLLILPVSFLSTQVLLRPFKDLASRTKELSAEKLSFRFAKPKHLDEYGMLANNFNLLLDRLEKSFNQMRSFAVSASHELRTPLSVIIGQGEMILRRPPALVSDCLPVIQKMLSPAKNLRDVINRLFLLAEVEQLEQENVITEIPIKKMLSQITSEIQEHYPATKKEILIYVDEAVTTRSGNKELFTCIVSNLTENAVKYSKNKIWVQVKKTKSHLELYFEDDGPGIDFVKREQVFKPFFRVTGKTDSTSHGLGLSIVKACVLAEKGSIELEDSTRLGGLMVKVSLPNTESHLLDA
jgi:signal transduction histidine kinase